MLLAKFIMDYSFERIIEGQLSDDDKNGYYAMSNSSFSNIFNDEFSEVGMNFEDMQEEIEEKVTAYFRVRSENRRPPECYYQIHMLITGSNSLEELEEAVKKKTVGLEFMRSNENFSTMCAQYEAQIKELKQKIAAFDLADIMLPHMFRLGRQRLKKN